MKSFSFALVLLLSICSLFAQENSQNQAESMEDFLVLAVFEGLYQDQANPKLIQKILAQSQGKLFVPKCPICRPVQRGLKAYLKAGISGSGEQWDEAQEAVFEEGDLKTQRETLSKILNGYIQSRFQKLDLSSEQASRLESDLIAARKRGMANMGDMEFCPSCDGVCDIKR